jgi:hypothetical protein
VAGIVLPLEVVGVLIQASVDPGQLVLGTTSSSAGGDGSSVGVLIGGAVALGLVTWVAILVANLACYRAAGDAWTGEPPAVSRSLRQGARRILPYIGMELIVVVVAVVAILIVAAVAALIGPLGLILVAPLVVAGFWVYPIVQVAQAIVVLERIGPIRSLKRAFGLVRGGWWRTFAAMVVAVLLLFVVFSVIGVLLGAILGLAAGDSEVAGAIARVVIDTVALAVSLPFVAAVNTIIYYDRRVRREGLDLELQAAAPRWQPPSADDHVSGPAQAPEPEPEPEPAGDRGRADWLPPEAPRGPGGL